LAQLIHENWRGGAAQRGNRRNWGGTVDWIAGLTAVDGAVVINDRYELLGFGAKLARRRNTLRSSRSRSRNRFNGPWRRLCIRKSSAEPATSSAAQFVHDQRDAIALVASQDGRFTILEWSPCESMVHGHRVETLLL